MLESSVSRSGRATQLASGAKLPGICGEGVGVACLVFSQLLNGHSSEILSKSHRKALLPV